MILRLLALALALPVFVANANAAFEIYWTAPFFPVAYTGASVGGQSDSRGFAADYDLDTNQTTGAEVENANGSASASYSLVSSLVDGIFTAEASGLAELATNGTSGSATFEGRYSLWIQSDEPFWFNFTIDGSPLSSEGSNIISYMLGLGSTLAALGESGSYLSPWWDYPLGGRYGMSLDFFIKGVVTTPEGENPASSYLSNSKITFSTTPVPEPSTLMFVGGGVLLLAVAMRRKRKSC